MQDFAFSADDLTANRAGKLSTEQRALWERKRRTMQILVGLCLIFFLATLAFAYAVLTVPDGFPNNLHPTIEIVGFAFLLLTGVRIRHIELGRDLRANDVASVRGSLILKEDLSRWGGRYYKVEIATARFKISEAVYRTLKAFQDTLQGQACVIYYSFISKTILSFESVDSAPLPRHTAFQDALARTYDDERRKDRR